VVETMPCIFCTMLIFYLVLNWIAFFLAKVGWMVIWR
jgi:hypothetical protein